MNAINYTNKHLKGGSVKDMYMMGREKESN